MTKKWITKKIQFEREIIDVVRNSYIKDDIFRSDFLRSFIQFQHHNITSDKWSDQNNATLLFVHFNFIIQFRKMFLFLKSIHIAQYIKSNLCFVYWVLLCFVFFFFFFVFFFFFFFFFKDMHYNTMIRTFCILKKNDVQCFSSPDFVGPLWGIRCTY